uniref:Uncharacterized protein n=1 Tax=Panagrolaimus sp. PS1159 TaxID=55785 RepID=A0AC35FDJ1_9BILA
MLCNENSPILYDRVLLIVTTLIIAIIALIFIHITLAVEVCIQRTSEQLLEQSVMREEAPDYYLGEDTKYYTYVPAEDDKQATNAPVPVAPAAADVPPQPPPAAENKPVDDLESNKKLKENEKK